MFKSYDLEFWDQRLNWWWVVWQYTGQSGVVTTQCTILLACSSWPSQCGCTPAFLQCLWLPCPLYMYSMWCTFLLLSVSNIAYWHPLSKVFSVVLCNILGHSPFLFSFVDSFFLLIRLKYHSDNMVSQIRSDHCNYLPRDLTLQFTKENQLLTPCHVFTLVYSSVDLSCSCLPFQPGVEYSEVEVWGVFLFRYMRRGSGLEAWNLT